MYQTLYRVYRPKTFDEVLGQEHIVKSLKSQVKNNLISHAYLFTGERGTGKTSTAKILTRAVNCEHPIDGNPCNECPTCRAILNNETLDVSEMDAASNRSIQDIRVLKEMVVYPPTVGRYKCYIVDEVHMLTNEAFNALLKTLEEPPEYLVFILATTEPEKLPDTIISRCQRFDFKRVSERILSENILRILKERDREIEPQALNMIVREAKGSVRDSLSILERFMGYSDKRITEEDAVFLFGSLSEESLMNIARSVLASDARTLISSLHRAESDGKDIHFLYRDLIRLFRDLLLIKLMGGKARSFLYVEDSEFKMLEETSKMASKSKLEEILKTMIEKEFTIKKSSLPEILTETLLLSFMDIEDIPATFTEMPKRSDFPSPDMDDYVPDYFEYEEEFFSFPPEVEMSGNGLEEKNNLNEKKVLNLEKNDIIKNDNKIEEKITLNVDKEFVSEENNRDEIPEQKIIGTWKQLLKDGSSTNRALFKDIDILGAKNNVLVLKQPEEGQSKSYFATSRDKVKEMEGLLSGALATEMHIKFEKSLEEKNSSEYKKKQDDIVAISDYFEDCDFEIVEK